MAVFQPAQKINAFLPVGGCQRRFFRGKGYRLHARQHGGPVLHGAVHIAQDTGQFIGQRLLLGRTHNAVAFHQNERLHRVGPARSCRGCCAGNGGNFSLRVSCHAHQRMNDPVRRAVAAVDGHGDGVHQERHVVLHDLHHGVVACKSVLGQCGVKHPYAGHRCGARRIQQTPVRIGYGKQRSRAAGGYLVGVGVVKVGGYEAGEFAGGGPCVFRGVGQQFGERGAGHEFSVWALWAPCVFRNSR